jgi:hypothetical protein
MTVYLQHLFSQILENYMIILDDWLTVHRSITLVDLQLEAQNSYLFTYNTFIKIIYMFRALPCSTSGGVLRNCIYAASGIVTLLHVSRAAVFSQAARKLLLQIPPSENTLIRKTQNNLFSLSFVY